MNGSKTLKIFGKWENLETIICLPHFIEHWIKILILKRIWSNGICTYETLVLSKYPYLEFENTKFVESKRLYGFLTLGF